MNERERKRIEGALAPTTTLVTEDKSKHTPKIQPKFRKGLMRDAIVEAARNMGAGMRFTGNDAWRALTDATRGQLQAGYDDPRLAKTRFINNLAKYAKDDGKGYVPGLRQAEIHRGGDSVFVWTPPTTAVPNEEVGATLTFTVVGKTSDGGLVYRNEQEGTLGWVEWSEL